MEAMYNDKSEWFLTKRNTQIRESNSEVDILQIGDSIMSSWNFSRYFPIDKVVINSGIGGDISSLLLKRLNRDCLDYNPKQIILMIGINDIREYFKVNPMGNLRKKQQLITNISKNIINIINQCNGIKLIWCEILPINEEKFDSHQLNLIIQSVNCKVRKGIFEYKNVKIIKFDQLQMYDGRLDKNLTDDGLHPNDDGYSIMSDKIRTIL